MRGAMMDAPDDLSTWHGAIHYWTPIVGTYATALSVVAGLAWGYIRHRFRAFRGEVSGEISDSQKKMAVSMDAAVNRATIVSEGHAAAIAKQEVRLAAVENRLSAFEVRLAATATSKDVETASQRTRDELRSEINNGTQLLVKLIEAGRRD